MREFLDELPPELYYDLLKIYLIDFQIFGYDLPPPEIWAFQKKVKNENRIVFGITLKWLKPKY